MDKRKIVSAIGLFLLPIGQPIYLGTAAIFSSPDAIYSLSAKSETKNAQFYYERGLKKSDKGIYKGAISDYNKAIEINYPNPNEEKYILFNNRGNVKYELGDEKGACKDYKFAASIGDAEGVEWLKSKDGKWCGKMEF